MSSPNSLNTMRHLSTILTGSPQLAGISITSSWFPKGMLQHSMQLNVIIWMDGVTVDVQDLHFSGVHLSLRDLLWLSLAICGVI